MAAHDSRHAKQDTLHEKIDQVLETTESGPRAQDRPVPADANGTAPDLPNPPPRLKPDTRMVEGEDAIQPPPEYDTRRHGALQG